MNRRRRSAAVGISVACVFCATLASSPAADPVGEDGSTTAEAASRPGDKASAEAPTAPGPCSYE